MAFTNLFSKLATIDEVARRPDQPDFIFRTKAEGDEGDGKRKTQMEPSYKKKRCYQNTMSSDTTTRYDDFQAKRCRRWGTESDDSAAGEDMRTNHSSKRGYNSRQSFKSQNYRTKQNFNVKKQQQQPKKFESNQQQPRNRGRNDNRGGRFLPRKDKRNYKDTMQEKPRYMSQEFKDQNGLLVDGRLLCRHFLYGRCIKADECQLEHVQGYNDLLKEACKFYIQGFCLKGETCPYMHKSFPCKYFHQKGKCFQEENCRFSHDPLNDVTEKLLDAVLKQEKENQKLLQEAKQDSSEPTNTDETETVEANKNPDILTQPLWTSFYNSTEAEEETNTPQTDERVSDAVETHSSPSLSPNQQQPVCYSVEAVLGSQRSRTFSNFSKTFGSEESSPSVSVPPVSSDSTPGSVKQSEAPYSVDAVLRSSESVKIFTFGSTLPPPPPAQPVFYMPDLVDPLCNGNEKMSQNIKDADTSHENVSKNISSHLVNSVLGSDIISDLLLTSKDSKEQCSATLKCQTTPQRIPHEDKLDLTSVKQADKSAFSRSKEGTCSEISTRHTNLPKYPAPPKLNHSVLISNSQSSPKLFSPSLNVRELKGRAAVPRSASVKTRDSKNVGVHHFAARQFTEILPKKVPTLKCATLEDSLKITPKDPAHPSVGFNKTQNRPFCRLFANPLIDGVMPTSATAPVCSQSFDKAQQSPDVKEKTFISLFAAPLSETRPLPSSQPQTASCTQHSADNTKSTLNLKTLDVEPQVGPDEQISQGQTSEPSPNLKNENESVNQLVTSVSSQPGSPSGRTEHQPTAVSSPRETSSNSVLKTLFLHLKPYQEDGEHNSERCSEIVKKRSSMDCVVLKQQQQTGQRSNTNLSTEEAASLSADPHTSPQTPQDSSVAVGGSTVTCPGVTEPQVRNTGTHTFPFKPVTQLMQHPSRLRARLPSEEVKKTNGGAAATPLKELFKTLDTTVFHN